MNLRNLIVLTGIAALAFSLGDLFIAGTMASWLGGQLSPFAIGAVQLRGAVG